MRVFFFLPLLSILFFGCPSDDDVAPIDPDPICGEFIQLVSDIPDAADTPQGIEASVDGLCLSITVGFSGCSPDPWTMELYTTGEIAESLPTQSRAYFVFNDGAPGEDQLCQAFFNRTFEFDLTPYLAESLPSILRIDGTDIEVLVE
ncbi:MAG: hypothetical protein AAFY36_18870 [Bacteroidota bacterium]